MCAQIFGNPTEVDGVGTVKSADDINGKQLRKDSSQLFFIRTQALSYRWGRPMTRVTIAVRRPPSQ
jgi:hypothetical protein